jgi:hypothetical protein
MGAFTTINPDNGFKKVATAVFAIKLFLKFINIHGISSFFGKDHTLWL